MERTCYTLKKWLVWMMLLKTHFGRFWRKKHECFDPCGLKTRAIHLKTGQGIYLNCILDKKTILLTIAEKNIF